MTTVVGDNSENALTLSFDAASPRSADRQIMFRRFGWESNWSRTLPHLSDLIALFFLCMIVFVCVCVLQQMFLSKLKKVRPSACSQGKCETHVPSFILFLQHMRTHERSEGRCFHFFSSCTYSSKTGTLSGNKRSLLAGWSRSVNWFELMLFQEKSMHFLTAAITPLTSIHQEICMR